MLRPFPYQIHSSPGGVDSGPVTPLRHWIQLQSADNTPGQSSCIKSLIIAPPLCFWEMHWLFLQLDATASSASPLLFYLLACCSWQQPTKHPMVLQSQVGDFHSNLKSRLRLRPMPVLNKWKWSVLCRTTQRKGIRVWVKAIDLCSEITIPLCLELKWAEKMWLKFFFYIWESVYNKCKQCKL